MNYSQPRRYDFRTRIQVPYDSSDAVILDYLKTDRRRVASQKEMLLSALRPYWLPIAHEALRESGRLISDEELARMAQNAILQLGERGEMLRQRFCPRFNYRIFDPPAAQRPPDPSRPPAQNRNYPHNGEHRPG
jgi:hypothetical protein